MLDFISNLMVWLCLLCMLAVPVLLIIFVVRWIRKKPKMWIGLSALFCFIGIFVTALIGGTVDYASMTPEEKAAYYEELEQKEAEKAAKEKAEAEKKAAEEKKKAEEAAQAEAEKAAEKAAEEKKKAEEAKKAKHTHTYVDVEYTANLNKKKATLKQECSSCGDTKTTTSDMSTEDVAKYLKENCKTYTYEEIARYPDEHKNELAVFTGEVVQVQELLGTTTLLVSVTKEGDEYFSYYTDTVYVTYKFTDGLKVLEGDIITMYGELQGEKTYISVLGSTITTPLIKVYYAELSE